MTEEFSMVTNHESTDYPTYSPLVKACLAHGIGRNTAFELARSGKLETFRIGSRRFVYTESLRTLPERLAAEAAKAAP